MHRLLLPLLLVVVGCDPLPGGDQPGTPAPLLDREKPHKGAAVSDEEKLVEKYVRGFAQYADEQVTIYRWGPHDYTGYTHFEDPKKLVLIRVVYATHKDKQQPQYGYAIFGVGDPELKFTSSGGASGPIYDGRMVGPYSPPDNAGIGGAAGDDWREAPHRQKELILAGRAAAEKQAKGE